MLRDLKKNEFVTKIPWKKDLQKGYCANNRECKANIFDHK